MDRRVSTILGFLSRSRSLWSENLIYILQRLNLIFIFILWFFFFVDILFVKAKIQLSKFIKWCDWKAHFSLWLKERAPEWQHDTDVSLIFYANSRQKASLICELCAARVCCTYEYMSARSHVCVVCTNTYIGIYLCS